MTLEEKVKYGLCCHRNGICKKCPYQLEEDIMLDPRIDPNYDAHIIDRTKECRDKLISDITAIFGWERGTKE